MREFLLTTLNLYQKFLSPDHSFWARHRFPQGYCRFYPSCSEYARLAILKHGSFWGAAKFFWRVLRCNPWSAGGLDPVN